MSKYIEIVMMSGAKFYMVSDESTKYSNQNIDYALSGNSGASIKVSSSSSGSPDTYINPRLIESFKVFY